ncbi:MAG: ISL3 family transposase [Ktedonobacteraceae bacterium]
MTIFPDLTIEHTYVAQDVTITLRSTSLTADCPCCGVTATRVQSRYTRTPHDLPVSGRSVHLIVRVRRFFCDNTVCFRTIFAEQFPSLVRPRAKLTTRLQEALCQLGFALGGEAGARLGDHLGFPGSPDTILRLVRTQELPPPPPPRVIGIDDWAWKRRLRYGTIICDLERGVPIDLLPDRSVATVSQWLQSHPSIEIISRDRASEYATAARKSASQAIQVADRWHLAKNLTESLSTLLTRCRAEIRRAFQVQIPQEEQVSHISIEVPNPEVSWSARRSRGVSQTQRARRAERVDRYEQVISLQQHGLRIAEIAHRVGMSERTVRSWLAHASYPEPKQRRRRPSLIDPYQEYVQQQWREGLMTGPPLSQELKARGYQGSERAMYRYLETLRLPPTKTNPLQQKSPEEKKRVTSPLIPSGPLESFSAHKAIGLFLRESTTFEETEQQDLLLIQQASPTAQQAYLLVQAFMHMVRERTGEDLDAWLNMVQDSHIPEFTSFAAGIQRDKAAVLARLTLSWNNGPTEGHVNRLKLIKRSMYGRAKFDLLRARVLHTA